MTTTKQKSAIWILASGIPIATLATWLWAGVGYTKDIEKHSEDIKELKIATEKTVEVNQHQEIVINELRVMFEMIQSDLKEIKEAINNNKK